MHTIRVKILGLELSLWLVINKGLGGFVLTLDSCLQPLPCEGKMIRTTIRCPSYYCLESLTLFFLYLSKFPPWKTQFRSHLFVKTSPDQSRAAVKISSLIHQHQACLHRSINTRVRSCNVFSPVFWTF